jgi:hypothetical protein
MDGPHGTCNAKRPKNLGSYHRPLKTLKCPWQYEYKVNDVDIAWPT